MRVYFQKPAEHGYYWFRWNKSSWEIVKVNWAGIYLHGAAQPLRKDDVIGCSFMGPIDLPSSYDIHGWWYRWYKVKKLLTRSLNWLKIYLKGWQQ